MNEERRKRLIEISDKLLDLMVDLNNVLQEARDEYYNIIWELHPKQFKDQYLKKMDALRCSCENLENTRDSVKGAIEE